MLSVLLIIWLKFIFCAVLIGIAGAKLTHYADVIGDKTGVSGSWVGLILLASVTSLPELITGISALVLAEVPDIAAGGIMGSCVFNLVILVILDYLLRGQSIYHRASLNHVLSAAFSIALIAFAGLNMLLAGIPFTINIGTIGFYTPIIIIFYLIAMRSLFIHEHSQIEQSVKRVASRYPEVTLPRAIAGYITAAMMVIAAGIYLPFVSTELAEEMHWNQSFVGTLFVALATSLPELAVTIAALRINALNMAIANVLGSNLFNIAILAINDLFFLKGALFSYISPIHAISAFSAALMTGIVMIGLIYRPQTRVFLNIGWVSLGLLLLYLFNTYVLYQYDN